MTRPPSRGRARVVAGVLALLPLAAACAGERAGLPTASPPPTSRAPATPSSSPSVSSAPTPPGSPSAAAEQPCGRSAAPGAVRHVIWIWMENHPASAVFGQASAPYENALKTQCASSSTYRQVGSPSLPNYIGAVAGDTFGIGDDASPAAHHLTADNLFRQVRTAGGSSRSYEEAMTAPCQLSSHGRYAVKHNPAAYFIGADDRSACLRDNLPLGDSVTGALAGDLAHGTLPAFAFVTPDLCHDTHDCAVAQGDQWLAEWLPRIVDSPDYRRGDTAVFVVWDEDTPMPLLVVSPAVAPGRVIDGSIDHYSLLRTTEELLGLPLLGHAASATSLRAGLGL